MENLLLIILVIIIGILILVIQLHVASQKKRGPTLETRVGSMETGKNAKPSAKIVNARIPTVDPTIPAYARIKREQMEYAKSLPKPASFGQYLKKGLHEAMIVANNLVHTYTPVGWARAKYQDWRSHRYVNKYVDEKGNLKKDALKRDGAKERRHGLYLLPGLGQNSGSMSPLAAEAWEQGIIPLHQKPAHDKELEENVNYQFKQMKEHDEITEGKLSKLKGRKDAFGQSSGGTVLRYMKTDPRAKEKGTEIHNAYAVDPDPIGFEADTAIKKAVVKIMPNVEKDLVKYSAKAREKAIKGTYGTPQGKGKYYTITSPDDPLATTDIVYHPGMQGTAIHIYKPKKDNPAGGTHFGKSGSHAKTNKDLIAIINSSDKRKFFKSIKRRPMTSEEQEKFYKKMAEYKAAKGQYNPYKHRVQEKYQQEKAA